MKYKNKLRVVIVDGQQINAKNSVWVIVSLVSSIFAFVSFFIFGILGPVLFGIVGVVSGVVALVKIKGNTNLKGKGVAIAGIIIGALSLVVPLVFGFAILAYFGVLS
ncbi:MAG: DUF4190 domain-containing protein [Nanoarchaeota archaeon]